MRGSLERALRIRQTSESPNDRLRDLASILVGDGKLLRVSEKSKATTAEHQELESVCRVKLTKERTTESPGTS